MQIRFDDVEIPVEKLDAVIDKSMEQIREQYRVKKRKRHMLQGMAAAIILLTITVCFSNPVLAAKLPLIGHIFKLVQEKQMYPGDFDKVSEPVQENSSKSGGITITLSEIYCNTEALYATMLIETEEPFPEGVKESNIIASGQDIGYRIYLLNEQQFDFLEPEAYKSEYYPDGNYWWYAIELRGEYQDSHTFAGMCRIPFQRDEPLQDVELPDTFRWKLTIENIHLWEGTDYGGEWIFETDVNVDHSHTELIPVNDYAPDGNGIESVIRTPYEVIINYGYDESRRTTGYEGDTIQSVMLDADGRYIKDKVGMFSPGEYNLSELIVYYYEVRSEEENMNIQKKLYDGTSEKEIQEYFERISVYKTVIEL